HSTCRSGNAREKRRLEARDSMRIAIRTAFSCILHDYSDRARLVLTLPERLAIWAIVPSSPNPEKARRAAANPDRPGERCRAEPGRFTPRIDPARCGGKRECVEVCPFGVFEGRRMDDVDFAGLSLFGRLKSLARRRQTAYAVGA